MTLSAEVDRLWTRDHDRQVAKWLKNIEKNIARTKSARQCFHQWHPLRVYVNASELMGSGGATFSLRFKGQEVAKLVASNKGLVELKIEACHLLPSKRDFKFTGLGTGSYGWKSPEGRILRDYFKKNANNSSLRPRQPEHEVETNIIKEMTKKRREVKFGGKFHNIQPVTIEGCPLQMPLPISGCSGAPKLTKGNIDILARRVSENRRVHLSVWELKKPGVTTTIIDKAIRQAFIYAIVLAKILRTDSGPGWYRLFGFKRQLPDKLKVEAVVVLSTDDRKKFLKVWPKYEETLPITTGNDEILPCVAFYDKNTYAIESFQLLA